MIYIGLKEKEKCQAIKKYCEDHNIQSVVVFSPNRFNIDLNPLKFELIDWPEIIMYRTFYRLLQEIDNTTLVVVNECLRTQNRYDLTYNCIRNCLNQTKHTLVMQKLPCVDSIDDFMILFDFASSSKWKHIKKFDPSLVKSECGVMVENVPISFHPLSIDVSEDVLQKYRKEKDKLIKGIGMKDPHTIPRNLYLMSGKSKVPEVSPDQNYIGRNNRFDLPNLTTYKQEVPDKSYVVFELPHRFIEFSDLIATNHQTHFDVLSTNLKVDQWYLQRYNDWGNAIEDGISALR